MLLGLTAVIFPTVPFDIGYLHLVKPSFTSYMMELDIGISHWFYDDDHFSMDY